MYCVFWSRSAKSGGRLLKSCELGSENPFITNDDTVVADPVVGWARSSEEHLQAFGW